MAHNIGGPLNFSQAIRLNPQKPLTKTERQQIGHYRNLRARVHEGPLYTILGDNARVGKTQASSVAAQRDPFEGMPRYSDKYKKKTRRIPRLDTRPYGELAWLQAGLFPLVAPPTNSTNSTQILPKRALVNPRSLPSHYKWHLTYLDAEKTTKDRNNQYSLRPR